MVISKLGSVRGNLRSPCLYFIFIENYAYVGETQKLPVIRWGQHVLKRGTFYSQLERRDAELCQQLNNMAFFAYTCEELVYQVRDFETRSVLKYLEHKAHEKFICHPVFGPKYELISDTSRSAPNRCLYSWIEALAKEIVASCFNDWKISLHGYSSK